MAAGKRAGGLSISGFGLAAGFFYDRPGEAGLAEAGARFEKPEAAVSPEALHPVAARCSREDFERPFLALLSEPDERGKMVIS